jgi:hypothetical protein
MKVTSAKFGGLNSEVDGVEDAGADSIFDDNLP